MRDNIIQALNHRYRNIRTRLNLNIMSQSIHCQAKRLLRSCHPIIYLSCNLTLLLGEKQISTDKSHCYRIASSLFGNSSSYRLGHLKGRANKSRFASLCPSLQILQLRTNCIWLIISSHLLYQLISSFCIIANSMDRITSNRNWSFLGKASRSLSKIGNLTSSSLLFRCQFSCYLLGSWIARCTHRSSNPDLLQRRSWGTTGHSCGFLANIGRHSTWKFSARYWGTPWHLGYANLSSLRSSYSTFYKCLIVGLLFRSKPSTHILSYSSQLFSKLGNSWISRSYTLILSIQSKDIILQCLIVTYGIRWWRRIRTRSSQEIWRCSLGRFRGHKLSTSSPSCYLLANTLSFLNSLF